MKLLKTLQTLVDKTKELEETVATQTSTIEQLTTKLDLDNKDTDKTDIKQEYQELRDKFINTLFSQVVVRNAVVDKKISLKTSDIFDGKRISVILTDCNTTMQYGYIINLNNPAGVLLKIIKEVTSIVDNADDSNNDTEDIKQQPQPDLKRLAKDITDKLVDTIAYYPTTTDYLPPIGAILSDFLLDCHYIHGYSRSYNIDANAIYEFDYKGKRHVLYPYDTKTKVNDIIYDIMTTSNKGLEQLLDNYIKWTTAKTNKQ